MDLKEIYLIILFVLFILVSLIIFSGCTTIEKGDFKYQSTIFDKKVDELVVVVDSNGTVKSVMMKNYNSNADYIVEAVKAVAK